MAFEDAPRPRPLRTAAKNKEAALRRIRPTASPERGINKRGALIKVLDKPHLDLTTPIGRGFIAMVAALDGGDLADRRNVDSHQAGVHRRAHFR